MEQEDYWLLHKGFYNKKIDEKRTLRWAVAPIIQVFATKKINPYKIMPLPGDDELQRMIAKSDKDNRELSKEAALQIVEKIKSKQRVPITDRLKALEALKNDSGTDRS
jgi:hypothetical protein